MSVATYNVSTIGQVEKGEVFTFQSRSQYFLGTMIDLRTQKPSNAPVYGSATIVGVRVESNGLYRYDARRIN